MILTGNGLIITFYLIGSNLLWMTFFLRVLDLQDVLSHLAWFSITFIWIKVCQLLTVIYNKVNIDWENPHKQRLFGPLLIFKSLKNFQPKGMSGSDKNHYILILKHYHNTHNLECFSVLCHLGLDYLVFGGVALLNCQHWSFINY